MVSRPVQDYMTRATLLLALSPNLPRGSAICMLEGVTAQPSYPHMHEASTHCLVSYHDGTMMVLGVPVWDSARLFYGADRGKGLASQLKSWPVRFDPAR